MRYLVQVDVDETAKTDLTGGYQVRKRVDKEAFYGSLQVAGAILEIQSFSR